MSHSSYTASERRGIISIAVIALLIMGFGAGLSLCSNDAEAMEEEAVVVVHPEMIDSTAIFSTSSSKGATNKKRIKSPQKFKNKKIYKRRSPLDEHVSPKE